MTAEPPQLGDAGGLVAQEDAEQAAGDRQADAFGLGGAGELGLQVGGEDDGPAPLGLELLQAGSQVGDLLLQAGELLLLGGAVEVAEDGVGFAVEALARDAALLGVVADVAAAAEADDGGTGETQRRD